MGARHQYRDPDKQPDSNAVVNLKMSSVEKLLLMRAAQKNKMSLSGYIRHVAIIAAKAEGV